MDNMDNMDTMDGSAHHPYVSCVPYVPCQRVTDYTGYATDDTR